MLRTEVESESVFIEHFLVRKGQHALQSFHDEVSIRIGSCCLWELVFIVEDEESDLVL